MKVKTSTASRAKNRVVGIIVSLCLIVFVCIVTAISAAENKKTVAVVRTKEPISANAMITDSAVESYDMYYKEFSQYGVVALSDGSKKQAIVTWDNKDSVINKRYAAYYLRQNTALFWDSTVKEQTKKNSYLYSMDGELLNVQLNTSDFGDMVVPGDTLNIRVSYQKTNYDLPSEEVYQLAVSNGTNISAVTTTTTEMLFSEVSVLDMLNSSGTSIFDIYYDYISKSKKEQAALLADKKFLDSVKPKTILLEVTSEEADRYMEISSMSPTYLMTLLPRTGSNSIIDSLGQIQTAIGGTSSTTTTK